MSQWEDCFGDSIADEIVALVFNVLGIIIAAILCALSYGHLSSTARMNLPLQLLYFGALSSSFIAMVGSIANILVCPSLGSSTALRVSLLTVYPAFLTLGLSLQLSFVVRLFVTFEKSPLKISRMKLNLMIVIAGITFAYTISNAILYWIGYYSKTLFFVMVQIGFLLYASICAWPVYKFVRNLMAMAKMRSSSLSARNIDNALCEQQLKLIKVSSKYLSLFIVAISSSIVCHLLVAASRLYLDTHPGVFWSIDCVANDICLYLFQGFAAEHYNRYCFRLDSCCKKNMNENVIMENLDSWSRRTTSGESNSRPSSPAPPNSPSSQASQADCVVVYDQSVSPTPNSSKFEI